MAKSTSKTSKTSADTSGEDIMDAVDDSAPTTQSAPAAASSSESSKPAPKKKKDDLDDVDDRNPVMAFVYDHPWITFFIFYLVLTALVRVWGWATMAFLIIPLVCFARIWMLSRKTDETLDHEEHLKVAWWAKVGMMSSIFGLSSALILNWLGVLHIFN